MPTPDEQLLEELQAAAQRFRPSTTGVRASATRFPFVGVVAGSILAGAAAAWLVPVRFEAVVDVELPVPHPRQLRELVIASLSDRWMTAAPPDGEASMTMGWHGDGSSSTMRVVVSSPRGPAAQHLAETLAANSFSTAAASLEETARLSEHLGPVLRERLEELQRRVAAAEEEARRTSALTPVADPRDDRIASEAALRTAFSEVQRRVEDCRRLEGAYADLEALDPEVVAVVSGEERNQAYDADEMLKQDRAQLAAELTEVRRSMLGIHQSASVAADRLLEASAEFAESADRRAGAAELSDHVQTLATLSQQASSYRRQAADFLDEWNRLHVALADAAAAETISLNERIEEAGRQFFFDGAQLLEEATTALRGLRERPGLTAAVQTAASELSRRCNALQQAQDHLQNQTLRQRPVRLQAALEASHRLGARVREQMGIVDRQLTAEAVEKARRQRSADLAATRDALSAARRALIEDALNLESRSQQLIAEWNRSLEHQSRTADARAARAALERLQEEERWLQDALAAAPPASPITGELLNAIRVRVRSAAAAADGGRIRLRMGLVVALASLAAGFLAQGLTRRRPVRP